MINRNGSTPKEHKTRGNNPSASKSTQLPWEDPFANPVDKSTSKRLRRPRITYTEDGFFERAPPQVVKTSDAGKKSKNKHKNCLVQ